MTADAAPRRVAHAILRAGDRPDALPPRLHATRWDMVELDVLARDGRLVVAHDAADLEHPEPLGFADALAALRDAVPDATRFDVDIKAVGYEAAVLDTLRSLNLVARTLVSTMEPASLRALRAREPALELGLSVPRARRNYLAHPLTRPAARVMLARLRRTLPARVSAALRSGLADAIMAHWGVITPALVAAVTDAGGELYAWTVDDPTRVAQLTELGVSAVITNDPAVFEPAGAPGALSGSPAAASPGRR